MTETARIVVTLAVFVAMIVLVVVRPRGWHEAWWTGLAAVVLLAFGVLTWRDALEATLSGKDALLFLLALLLLSLFVGKSGFFDWAAIWCARVARGDARRLYRNTFILGAVVTATLSLDTTAVILTPVVLAIVRRLKVPATPYVILSALVANVGSLLLPISNLTNILFVDTFRFSFAEFAARMLAPQLVVLAILYGLLRWHLRRELPRRFDVASLPAPLSAVPDRRYFVASLVVLVAVLVGYFLAPLVSVPPYAVAFGGALVLAMVGLVTDRVRPRALRELSWGVFPFVVGLFVAVRAVENLGAASGAAALLSRIRPGSPTKLLTAALATALASNAMNNLPAALLARSVLEASHAQRGTVLAALVGADVGPIVTPFGSLATMLVLALARQEGAVPPARRLLLFGACAAVAMVLAGTLALIATFVVVP